MPYSLTSAYEPRTINMIEFRDFVYLRTTIEPKNVVEIGSGHGHDADTLAQVFSVAPEAVYIFEPHPSLNEQINKEYPQYNVYDSAVSNIEGETVTFNSVDMNSTNRAVSSLLTTDQMKATYHPIEVTSRRMDAVLDELKLDTVDLLKIDVEGATYEVLEGFGDRLKDVKAMHIECEHVCVWEGQKLYRNVEELLVSHGFVLVHTKIVWPQSDCIWVHKDSYNPEIIDKMTEPCVTRWVVPAEPPAQFVSMNSRIDT
jgi:FkbM family methyltransferase